MSVNLTISEKGSSVNKPWIITPTVIVDFVHYPLDNGHIQAVCVKRNPGFLLHPSLYNAMVNRAIIGELHHYW